MKDDAAASVLEVLVVALYNADSSYGKALTEDSPLEVTAVAEPDWTIAEEELSTEEDGDKVDSMTEELEGKASSELVTETVLEVRATVEEATGSELEDCIGLEDSKTLEDVMIKLEDDDGSIIELDTLDTIGTELLWICDRVELETVFNDDEYKEEVTAELVDEVTNSEEDASEAVLDKVELSGTSATDDVTLDIWMIVEPEEVKISETVDEVK